MPQQQLVMLALGAAPEVRARLRSKASSDEYGGGGTTLLLQQDVAVTGTAETAAVGERPLLLPQADTNVRDGRAAAAAAP